MSDNTFENPRVVKCREMAAKSNDEESRRYWIAMAEFWGNLMRDERQSA
jgi:hypothetical protein